MSCGADTNDLLSVLATVLVPCLVMNHKVRGFAFKQERHIIYLRFEVCVQLGLSADSEVSRG